MLTKTLIFFLNSLRK